MPESEHDRRNAVWAEEKLTGNDLLDEEPTAPLNAIIAADKVERLGEIVEMWRGVTINSYRRAADAVDFDKQLADVGTQIEAWRVYERGPHALALEAVQQAYKPLLDKLDGWRDEMRALLKPWCKQNGAVRGELSGRLYNLRRSWKAVAVENVDVALAHYLITPYGVKAVAACLLGLAAADVRGGAREIPGIEIREEIG